MEPNRSDRDFSPAWGHNHRVRSRRPGPVVVLLLIGVLAALPGVAEGIESTAPGDDCSEPCPGDSSDGKCTTSCDECGCCARAPSAVFVPLAGMGRPGRVEIATAAVPIRRPRVLARGVYHPPRA